MHPLEYGPPAPSKLTDHFQTNLQCPRKGLTQIRVGGCHRLDLIDHRDGLFGALAMHVVQELLLAREAVVNGAHRTGDQSGDILQARPRVSMLREEDVGHVENARELLAGPLLFGLSEGFGPFSSS